MTKIEVIGRMFDESTDERAECEVVRSVSIPLCGFGDFHAVLLTSTDCNSRGGCILKITLNEISSSFLPYAKNIDGGVEIHMAGDVEAKGLLAALRALLA